MLGTEPPGRGPDDALGKVFLRACGRVSRGEKARGAAGRFKHLPRPPAPWRRLALASHGRARCGRYLKGSFTTTLTPAMTPVTAFRTWWTACWLTSPAPLMAPVAAAEAASDLGRAHDRAAEDVGYGRRQRGTHGARALDGGHQCAADRVDGSVQDLTGALDRPDHLVFHRLHDPLTARIHLAHAKPPSGGTNFGQLSGGRAHTP